MEGQAEGREREKGVETKRGGRKVRWEAKRRKEG